MKIAGGFPVTERQPMADRTALLSRVASTVTLGDDERRLLAKLMAGPVVAFERDQDLIRIGDRIERAYILHKGWAIWQDIRADGSRQVLDFFLPGDIVGLGGVVLQDNLVPDAASGTERRWDHLNVTALTPVLAVPVERRAFEALHRFHGPLGTRLLALAFIDRAARFRRRMANFGRESARARTADLMVELWERLRTAGCVKGNSFLLPASQSVLADFLCLAPAYLSRILTQFDRERVATVESRGERRVTIHDPARLRQIAAEEDGVSVAAGRRADKIL